MAQLSLFPLDNSRLTTSRIGIVGISLFGFLTFERIMDFFGYGCRGEERDGKSRDHDHER